MSDAGPPVAEALPGWAAATYGPAAAVEAVERMPGHGGISYGFDVVGPQVPGGRRRLVVRVPPAGVRQRNSTDVLRLAPLLRAMAADVPVPAVRHAGADERWFGVPYLVVDRVPGATLPDVFDAAAAPPTRPERVPALFAQAMRTLVAIHRVPTDGELAGWARPVTAREDVDAWATLLEKGRDAAALARGLAVREGLLAAAPPEPTPGVVHGDFYSNNWMFDGDRLSGVLDWENATFGPAMWDLGWICALYDPQCWGPSRHPAMAWTPGPDALLAAYADAGGRLHRPDWYRALMAYRLACITPRFLRLHRSGRRVDPIWEVFGEAVPFLFDRADALLAGEPSGSAP